MPRRLLLGAVAAAVPPVHPTVKFDTDDDDPAVLVASARPSFGSANVTTESVAFLRWPFRANEDCAAADGSLSRFSPISKFDC